MIKPEGEFLKALVFSFDLLLYFSNVERSLGRELCGKSVFPLMMEYKEYL